MSVLLRYIRSLVTPEILQQPQAQLAVSLSCILYLESSLDLVDPQIASRDTRSKILQRSHELHLYANDYWLDHLLALADFPVGSYLTRDGILPFRRSLERFTDRHNKLMALKGHGIQDNSELANTQLQDLLKMLGVSMAARSLLSKLFTHRNNASVDDGLLTKTDCMHPKVFRVSRLILSPCLAILDNRSDPTLLSSMRVNYQGIVEDLMEIEDPTDSPLCHFQARHVSGAFLCRYRSCPRATQGFGSSKLRQNHEYSHTQFRCTLIACGFFGRTFKTRAAMNKHARQYHDEGDNVSVPDFLPRRFPCPPRELSDSQNEGFKNPEASIGDVGNYLADLNLEDLPSYLKDEHDDWDVVYHPAVPRNPSLDNVCNVLSESVACSVCFSPDENFVAVGCHRVAKIFQTFTGLVEATLRHDWDNDGEDSYVRGLRFSPCGKFLATGGQDKLLKVIISFPKAKGNKLIFWSVMESSDAVYGNGIRRPRAGYLRHRLCFKRELSSQCKWRRHDTHLVYG